jgi:hypothetical protein
MNKKMSSISTQSIQTDTNWLYDDKKFTDFIGIEFISYYSSSEHVIFSLLNTKFNPTNLKQKIEENMSIIIEDKFEHGENYFKLIYKNEDGNIVKTEKINNSQICELYGKDYHSSLYMNFYF